MTRLVLREVERESLERLRSTTDRALAYRNATAILQAAEGRSKAELSRALRCSSATIDRVRRASRRDGLDGLLPAKPPGRPSRATPECRAARAEAVQTPPQALGDGFRTWSVPRVAAHLTRATEIAFSDDQLRRLLYREDFAVRRPKHTIKGRRDEAESERARGELEALTRGPSGPRPRRS